MCRGGNDKSRSALQLTLAAIGSVATGFGALGVLKGGQGVLDGGHVSANVDSELRFFAAWYTVVGVLLLRATRRPEDEAAAVRTCGAGFLLAACGRVLSARSVGPPSTVFKVLTAIEFAIPPIVIPWQGRVHRRSTLAAAAAS